MTKKWHDRRMRSVLLRFQDDELSPAQRMRLEKHLQNCAACRQRLYDWETAEQRLRQQMPTPDRLASQEAQCMFAAVRAQAEAQTRIRQRVNGKRSLGALAGACTLVAFWLTHSVLEDHKVNTNSSENVPVAAAQSNGGQMAATGGTTRKLSGRKMFSEPARTDGTMPLHVPQWEISKPDIRRSLMVTTKMGFHSKRLGHRIHANRTGEILLASGRLRRKRLASGHAPVRTIGNAGNAMGNAAEGAKGATFRPQETLSPMAQNSRGFSPDSHLLVTVTSAIEDTGANTRTGQAPESNNSAHSVQRTASDVDVSGGASVSALEVDESGMKVWRVCSIVQNKDGLTTVSCAAAWQNKRKLVSRLTVTTETVQGETK